MIGTKVTIAIAAAIGAAAIYGIATGATHHIATLALCIIAIITLKSSISTTTNKR